MAKKASQTITYTADVRTNQTDGTPDQYELKVGGDGLLKKIRVLYARRRPATPRRLSTSGRRT